MILQNKKIIFAITNCIYRFENILEQLKKIEKSGAQIIPVLSEDALKNKNIIKYLNKIEYISRNKILLTYDKIKKIESDIMIIAPCNRKYHN